MKQNITLSTHKLRNERRETCTTSAQGRSRKKDLIPRLLNVAIVGLFLLMTGQPVFAQKPNEKPKAVEQKSSNSISNPTGQTIRGVVLSGDDSTALDGANIVLQGTGAGTITNKEGRFVFPQQLKEGDVLLFSFVGQQTHVYKVPARPEDSVVIRMKVGFDLTGEIAMNEIYTRTSVTHKWWSKVKRMF